MKKLKVALIGAGFMGKTHSIGYLNMPVYFWPPPAIPVREIVVDVNESLAKTAAERFSFNRWSSKWENVIGDKDIDIVDIITPNYLHKPIAIAAAMEGKHIFCEKPLARSGREAKEMYDAAEKAGIKHMVGFNYRKIPAIAYARQLIEDGGIGEINHFRGFYISDWAIDPKIPLSWRFQSSKSGPGEIGDQGSHIIDIARYLVGDFKKVIAQTETFVNERLLPASDFEFLGSNIKTESNKKVKVDVDDRCILLIEFKKGVKGLIEVSRMACGHKNYLSFEINGTRGSLYFNWERNNELQYYSKNEPSGRQGYRIIQMGPNHPYGNAFWPIAGLNIGYVDSFIIEIYDFICGIVENKKISPSFYDGWKNCEIIDATLKSVKTGKWEECHK
jgi:predicted dehydrogenase